MVAPIRPIPLYRNADGDTYEPTPKIIMATPIIIKRTDYGFWAAMGVGVLALVLWVLGIPVLAVLIVGAVFGFVCGADPHFGVLIAQGHLRS